MADNYCVNITGAYPRITVSYAPAGNVPCDYTLISTANYQQQQAISENFLQWFHFDTTDALGAFAVGLTLWAAGIKLGAIIRTIFYTRR